MKKLQEIELKIKDESEDGVFAISLVENPAIEEDFVYLSKDEIQLKVIDEDKRIVVGFALVPEKRIYRVMQGKEFNIYFSKDTVRRSAELFMKKMNTQNFTLEHEEKVEGISVIESWIVEDAKQDKSNLYNLGAKGGEWVVMSKVYNDAVWNEIKLGKYGGYSIEAMYDGFEQLQSKNVNNLKMDIVEQIKDVLKAEVKLATFASTDEQLKRAEENYAIILDAINKVNAAKDNLKKIGSKTLELIDRPQRELKSDRDEFIKKVRDLGINPDSIPQPKQYDKAISRIDELFKKASQMYNENN
jgi:hypothetical protein